MTSPTDILLAEDDASIAKLIAFKLQKEKFEVTIAKDGQEAIGLFNAKPWCLVILDVCMPKANGWEVLKALRLTPVLDATPVLMLTAHGYKNLEVIGDAERGAQQYLKKPFDPNDLAQVVKRMVKV